MVRQGGIKGINLSVAIGRIKMANPVTVASGTFGYAQEFKDLIDLKRLGAITTKSITLKPAPGNPPPRIMETPAGVLNAVGLQNEGIDDFLEYKLPFLKKIGIPVIVSIAGRSAKEYTELTRRLDGVNGVSGIELNISCPNVRQRVKSKGQKDFTKSSEAFKAQGPIIAQDARATYKIVKAVRQLTKLTLITKLSPNVTDIITIAKAAVEAGTDALALVNTFLGMAIDINLRKPKLENITGGLSGPAIRPLALRMVWEVARKINVPIVGMGGIMCAEDAIEFFIAGATAVAVGTANLIHPQAPIEVINGIVAYMKLKKIRDIKKLMGTLRL